MTKMRRVVGLANKQSPVIFSAGFNELTIKVLTKKTQEFCGMGEPKTHLPPAVYQCFMTSIAGLPHGVCELSCGPPLPFVSIFHQYIPSNHG